MIELFSSVNCYKYGFIVNMQFFTYLFTMIFTQGSPIQLQGWSVTKLYRESWAMLNDGEWWTVQHFVERVKVILFSPKDVELPLYYGKSKH